MPISKINKQRKKDKVPTKIHPIAYAILAVFLLLIIVMIVFLNPSKTAQTRTDLNADVSRAQLNERAFYIDEKATNVEIVTPSSFSKKVKSSDKLTFLLVGGMWDKQTISLVAPFMSELTKAVAKDGVLESIKGNVDTTLNIIKVTQANPGETTKDSQGKDVPAPAVAKDLDDVEKLVELGLVDNKKYPKVLVFNKGKLVQLPYGEDITTVGQTSLEVKTLVLNFIEDVFARIK